MNKLVINRIEIASFGCLHRVLVIPNDGVNLLLADNESGKSTIAAFIKFMLYGFPKTKVQSIANNERILYMPWNGLPAEGAIELTLGNEQYRIERSFVAAGKEKLIVIDKLTKKQVMHGEVPGEVLLGAGEELFARTAFFRQLTLPQNSDDVLEEHLRNIAISADETAFADRAKKKLYEAKTELKNKQNRGKIPDLERERAELVSKVNESAAAGERVCEIAEKINNCKEKLSAGAKKLVALSEERAAADRYEAYERLQTIEKLKSASDTAEAVYNDALALLSGDAVTESEVEKLRRLGTEYGDACTAKSSAEHELATAEDEFNTCEKPLPAEVRAEVRRKLKRTLFFACILLAAAVIAAVVGIILLSAGGALPIIALSAAGVLACASAGAFISRASLPKKYGVKNMNELAEKLLHAKQLQKQLEKTAAKLESAKTELSAAEQTLSVCESKLVDEIKRCKQPDANKTYAEQIDEIGRAVNEISRRKAAFDAARNAYTAALSGADINALRAAVGSGDCTEPQRPRKKIEEEHRFFTAQLAGLNDMLRKHEVEMANETAAFDDPAVLSGKLSAVDSRLARQKERFAALSTAYDVLIAAEENVKSSVAPRIGAKASEYFGAVTGGKYCKLETGINLSMSFSDGFTTNNCEYLSAGARESAYLSLRFALSEIMYPDTSVPLFLDDAFVYLDDSRLCEMMKLMSAVGNTHQTFIFSCAKRVREALDASGCAYYEPETKQC